MATRKRRSSPRAKTKTVYRYRSAPARKGKRRGSTLNRSVKKPMQAAAVGLTLATLYGPAVMESVKQKKIAPVQNAVMNTFTNTNTAIEVGKQVAIAYIGGTVAGKVIDKTGLKKPVNKVIRFARGLI